MDSIGAGAARGLQAGWQMGMQADQAARQREQDALRQQQTEREFGLRQDAAQRAEQRLQHETERQDAADQYKLLNDEYKGITAEAASYVQVGQPLPPELAQRSVQVRGALRQHYESRMAPMLAAKQQDDARYWAGVQGGQIDPTTTPSAEFYGRFSRAVGMAPAALMKAAQGAQLVQQGFDAGNQQLVLQGVNQLVENDLRAGIGSPSPHGGVITHKQIVGLVPVKDANGVEHPDKVFPIVRVYVAQPDATGPAMENGATGYYDAPLTQNRSGDPNDPVKAIDLAHAFDYMGKLGAMAQLLQHPDVQRKLAEGEQEVGAQIQQEVDALTALGRAHVMEAAKGAEAQFYQLQLARLNRGEITPEQFNQIVAVRAKIAPSADVVARAESADARTDKRLASQEKVAAGHDETRIKTAGMRAATKGGKSEKAGAGMASTAGSNSASVLKNASPGERLRVAEALATGKNPTFRKNEDSVRFNDIKAAMMESAGLTLKDVVQQGDTMKLTSGAASELEKMYAAVESFSSTAKANMQVLEELSSKLPRSDIPIISRGQLAIESFTGNPVMSQYQGAMSSVTAEISRILNQPRLVGQLTDHARAETREFLNGNMTHSQLMALFKTLRVEMANREKGIVDMKNALSARRTGMADRVSGVAGMGTQPVAPMTGSGAPGGPTKPLPPGVKFLGFE